MKDGLSLLSSQYRTLNLAVHASAKGFRMSREGNIQVSQFSLPDLRRWSTNERDVMTGVNFILLAIYHDTLQGAALPNLRKTIAFSLSAANRQKVKDAVRVRIPAP